MKIRKGFISNSSSSSYIVSIRVSPEDFYQALWEEYAWNWFSKKKNQEELEKRIKRMQKDFEEVDFSTESGRNWLLESSTLWFERLIQDKEKLDSLNEKDAKELIKFVLEDNHIVISEDEDEIDLEYTTSMHNDFNEGITKLLKEIILYFLLDTKYKVKGRRISDEN